MRNSIKNKIILALFSLTYFGVNLFRTVEFGKADSLVELGMPFKFYRDVGEPCAECPEYLAQEWGFQPYWLVADVLVFIVLFLGLYWFLKKRKQG